jgi:hypothetical protein
MGTNGILECKTHAPDSSRNHVDASPNPNAAEFMVKTRTRTLQEIRISLVFWDQFILLQIGKEVFMVAALQSAVVRFHVACHIGHIPTSAVAVPFSVWTQFTV